jgi:hypothetical protein
LVALAEAREGTMLGEKIGDETGTVTTRRVLSVDGPPAVEISFAAEGAILGVKHRTLGTYNSQMRPDGTVFGQGQGIVMGAGGEMATWKGHGVGVPAIRAALSARLSLPRRPRRAL